MFSGGGPRYPGREFSERPQDFAGGSPTALPGRLRRRPRQGWCLALADLSQA